MNRPSIHFGCQLAHKLPYLNHNNILAYKVLWAQLAVYPLKTRHINREKNRGRFIE